MANSDLSFGQWVRRQRKTLDLTQEGLGQRVSCSAHTVRKIEADERRPSRRLTARMVEHLGIAASEQALFHAAARGLGGAGPGPERQVFDGVPAAAETGGPGDVNGDAPHEAAALGPSARDGHGPADRPFVGRERECRVLRRHLARLPVQQGRAVLVEGEAGIGKTRLMQEICAHALRAGLPAAGSKCHEIERDVAYRSLVDLIEQALALAPAGLEQRLDGVARAEIALLVPGLAARWQGLPTLSPELPQARQVRLCTAVLRLFQALAEPSGMLLVLDDLQWLDDASALALLHLVQHAADTRVLVLLACRSDDLNADARLGRLVAELQASGRLERMALPGLTRVDVAELLQPLWPAHAAARAQPAGGVRPGEQAEAQAAPGRSVARGEWLDRWHAWCRGNPLFLVAALDEGLLANGGLPVSADSSQAGPHTVPTQVQAFVRGRLAHLSAPARRLLDAAAAIGRGADFELMLAVAADPVTSPTPPVPDAGGLDALDHLLRRQWLTEDDESDGYAFRHDRLRDAVLAEMSAARRTLLHARVALHLGQRDAIPHALIAEHEEHARHWGAAAQHRLLAGMQAEAIFAVHEAIAHYSRGLWLAEQHAAVPAPLASELLERRGLAHAWLSQVDLAAADLQPAVTRALARLNAGRAVELLIALGMSYQRADRYAPGAEVLHQALLLARELNDHKSAAVAMWWLGDIEWTLDNNAAASGWFEQVMSLNQSAGLGDEVRIKAHHGLGEVAVLDARPDEGLAQFWQSLAIAQRVGDTRMVCENLIVIAWAHLGASGTGRYEAAMEHCDQVCVMVEQADMPWYLAPALVCKGAALAALGRFGEALACLGPALAISRELGMARFEAMTLAWLAECCLEAEQPALALVHAEHARHLMDEHGVAFFSHLLRAVHAQALIRLGRLDEVPDLNALLAVARQRRLGHAVLRTMDTLTEWQHARGDLPAAQDCADEWARLADTHGVPESRQRAQAWAARLQAAEGRLAESMQQLEALLAQTPPGARLCLRLALHRQARDCAAALGTAPARRTHALHGAHVSKLEALLAEAAVGLRAFDAA